MRWVAWVLYENHRTDQKEFALHKLVCAMVDDELGMLPYTTGKIVDGMPRKGIDKLLRDCSNDLVFAGLPAGSRFAVVDGDELPARVGLKDSSSLQDVEQALLEKYPGVHFAIPEAGKRSQSNTEQLLRCLADCLGLPANDPNLVRALDKRSSSRTDRDVVFGSALGHTKRAARDCLRGKPPPLDVLVRKLAAIVKASSGLGVVADGS